MNRIPSAAFGSGDRLPLTQSALRVISAYDSLMAAVYAHEAAGSMTLAARPKNLHVHNCVWSFDMLARLDLRHASIRAAAGADVIIISAAAFESLPAHMASWLAACFQQNPHRPPVLVALYEQETDNLQPLLRRDLAAVAASWRTPLVCNRELKARLERELIPHILKHRPAHPAATAALPADALPQSRRWGINE